MTTLRNFIFCIIALSIIGTGCHMTKTQKGAAVGTAAGGAVGAVVGRASGNTALGAIIGAVVGGVTGTVIGHKMDKQAEEIKKNIPNAKVERVGEGIIVEFSDKILFGFDKSDLSDGSRTSLNDLVTILGKYPDTNIEIQGHTDNVGSDTYNMDLSNRRASSVANYIISRGVSSSRISTKGYGESAPKYANDTEANRAQNRRVEFLISANEKMKADAKKEAETK
jgi:outer membrane protein OmpA-like peptidoglycan-associated protein